MPQAPVKLPLAAAAFCELFKYLGLIFKLNRYSGQMTSKFLKITAVALVLSSPGALAADDSALFPLPAGLERDVNFWVSIFTRYSTSEGKLLKRCLRSVGNTDATCSARRCA